MATQRVAVIFDNTLRRETTGIYCRRALGQLVEVEHFLPSALDRIPREGFDLYFSVDDGFDYALPDDLRPSAFWAIDTHIEFDRSWSKARNCDFTFAAQRDGAERLRHGGVSNALWLPLACDPELHGRQSVAKTYDVGFVGNLLGPRQQLLMEVQAEFPNTFVGNRYFEEMAAVYSASRIVFNRSLLNDVNMRVFEALCSGSLLITNDLSCSGQAELFQDGVHLVSYADRADLLDKIRWYLGHEEAREKIAAAGRAEALARHTYLHRMETILAVVEQRSRKYFSRAADVSRPKKESAYFSFARPEVLELVPTSAKRVLDIGCGAGRLGLSIKERQQAKVIGVEMNVAAAEKAGAHLDQVIVGNVEEPAIEFDPESLDCVICADVLEHLRRPRQVLEKIARWLSPQGVVVASIPNVRHHSIIQSLLQGNFTYEAAGLLDEDHVRLFTRREIEKLFFRAGFRILQVEATPGPGYREWELRGRPGEVEAGRLRIAGLTTDDAEEFYAYQFLLSAALASPPCALTTDPDTRPHGLTSIILITHNQLPYTHQCLESIRFVTDEPYELIVVDNASTDGTVEFLRAQEDMTLIENSENRGFPAAANQGIRAARGDQILLLNNDTLVTTGWLTRLLLALHADDTIGLVGPCTNNISGGQQVPVSYSDLSGLDGFAWEWGKRHDRRIVDTDRLVGFCLLIKREVVDAIGLLDEQFGIGNFEDDDYCRRAINAGYRCVIAHDAFIHHFGGATFRAAGVDFAGLMAENQRKYERKWASEGQRDRVHEIQTTSHQGLAAETPAAAGKPTCDEARRFHSSNFAIRVASGGGLLLERKQSSPLSIEQSHDNEITTECKRQGPAQGASDSELRLSLCMIVRDNEHTIRSCLESIKPWVDEMIVVDTGSKDATPKIAAELGARVYEFPWCDDFAAARNESLKYARGEWIFWMDSDDTIPDDCGRKLRDLADRNHARDVLGYVMQVHCPGGGDSHEDVTAVDHVKLFRNRADLRFEFRIHEQILPSIRRAGGDVEFTDIYVVHSGSDSSAAGRAQKYERDFRILGKDLAERPDHPFVLFNLGMTYADAGQHDKAVSHLRRCISVSQPEESHLRKAYALLVSSYAQAGNHSAAWEACEEGRRLFPQDAELLFRTGLLHHHFGRLHEAVRAYRTVLDTQEERHFASVDTAIGGFKARHNLAIVYEELHQFKEAELQWRHVTEQAPNYRHGWRGLGVALIEQQKFEDADRVADQLRENPPNGLDSLRSEGYILEARLARLAGNVNVARRDLEEACARFPNDLEPLRELCELLFHCGSVVDAVSALEQLTNRDADDGSAPHNLGTLLVRQGKWGAAAGAFRKSLRRRPRSPETACQLGNVLALAGSIDDARVAYQCALKIDPAHEAALIALGELADLAAVAT